MGFFDLVVEDTNVRKRHFFVKKCPQYCPKEIRNLLPAYLVDAIDYVTGNSSEHP